MSETLSQYLKRLMKQKGVTLREVEQKCDKKITNSYISRVINGKVSNLTIETIVALAKGFDVDPHEIFSAAYGKPSRGVTIDPLLLIDMLQKLAANPQLMELIREWMKLSEIGQSAILNAMERMNEQGRVKKLRKKE